MRADRIAPFLLDLHAGQPPRTLPRGKVRADMIDDDDDDDADEPAVMPWDEPVYTVAGGIAVVLVQGPIVKGYDAFTCWAWGLASLDLIEAACDELAGRTDVAMVVFRINSPGGMSQGTPESAAAIGRLNAAGKLTIAFTDTQACSAAYWLASACSRIVCTLTADVGCIGTYIAFYDYSKMLADMGIKLELFKRGDYKALGLPGAPLTEQQREFLDASVQRTNDRFLAAVRAGRGEVADSTMQGQWFDGEQAVALNLADEVVPSFASFMAGLTDRINQVLMQAAFSPS
jgi:ClpP class serine protease